jgi:diguanylate cyclase (GGDEF)-like protein
VTSDDTPDRPVAELEALHAAALALSQQLDPEAVLERIVEHAAALVTGSHGFLYVVDEVEGKLVEKIAQGPFAPFVGSAIGPDEGVAGLVWMTGVGHIENDYRAWKHRRRPLGAWMPSAVLGVPLAAHGRTVGVIGLCHTAEGRTFTNDDQVLVSRFAQLASLALERSELTAALTAELSERRRTEEELVDTVSRLTGSAAALRRTQEEMVRRLSTAAEHRDGATGSHIERVSLTCELIGRRLGLDESVLESIRIASPLHDIGKIGIPDHVLLKPGALDDAERSLIEQHAELGHRILTGSGSELLDLAASIALTHHERWDGTGYPRGLRGQEIPLEGRIVAVADVYDALTSDRVYRPAFSPEAALEVMRAGRGSQFDPEVLDAFLDGATVLVGGGETEPSRPPAADREPAVRLGRTDAVLAGAMIARGAEAAVRELGRFQETGDAVAHALKRLHDVAGDELLASVYVLDHGRLWCVAQAGYDQVRDGFDLGQGVMGRTLRTEKVQFVPDVQIDPEFVGAISHLVSELAFPLLGSDVRGVLNFETTDAALPPESEALLAPLAHALQHRIDTLPRTPRLDLATIARVCVHASSLRTVAELSDFATRTIGRLLGLDSTQIVLGENGDGQTTGFWRRPDSDHRPLSGHELAAMSSVLTLGSTPCDIVDTAEAGLDRRRVDAACLVWLPLRIAGDRAGTVIGRSARMLTLDSEQTEAATLVAQQAAALIDLAQALRRERRAAVTDSLTGLLNRRGFDERLREEIGRATRTRRPLALVLADCDDLKGINDGTGHEAGDRVLQAFANLLREQKRVTDIAGRLGGDEFALLLPETESDEAVHAAERLLERLRSLGETPITASFGVAVFPADGTTSSSLLRAADRALYAAKHGGKNRLATSNVVDLGRLAS